MIAVVHLIDNEARITEVERLNRVQSFYLTEEDTHIIWDNWNELQGQRNDLLALKEINKVINH
jgi:hypothetical protein